MFRSTKPAFVFVMIATCCLASEPKATQSGQLQSQIMEWLQAPDELDFIGTIEFIKTLELAPDPQRLPPPEYMAPPNLYDDFEPEVRDAYIQKALAISEFVTAAGIEGQTVVQTWRVHRYASNRMRAEFATASLRPPQPDAMSPQLEIAVENSRDAWTWSGKVLDDSPVGTISVPTGGRPSLLDQVDFELKHVFQAHRSWLSTGTVDSVVMDGSLICAKMSGELDTVGVHSPWSATLKFKSIPSGLVLIEGTVLNRENYWVCSYSDYRPLGERMIPWDSKIQVGPRSLFGEHEDPPTNPACYVDSYQIKSIREGFSSREAAKLFRSPHTIQSKSSVSYEGISGQDATAFVP